MEVRNILAKRIDTAGINASYDEACKRILANKQILAWILKTSVEEFRNCSIRDIEGTPKLPMPLYIRTNRESLMREQIQTMLPQRKERFSMISNFVQRLRQMEKL